MSVSAHDEYLFLTGQNAHSYHPSCQTNANSDRPYSAVMVFMQPPAQNQPQIAPSRNQNRQNYPPRGNPPPQQNQQPFHNYGRPQNQHVGRQPNQRRQQPHSNNLHTSISPKFFSQNRQNFLCSDPYETLGT